MKLHANAALTLRQRRRMVRLVCDEGWSVAAAAAEFKTSSKTCSKWVARYREASEAGLMDRSSACLVLANRTPERRVQAIAALRRLRMTGPEIAELLDMPLSTVSGILTRIGMGRLGRLGMEPAERYERDRPGELIHVDVKKLGRIQGGAGHRMTGRRHYNSRYRDRSGVPRCTVGWDYVHVAIDDATRLAYAEVLPRREGHHRRRIPRPRDRVLRQLRDHGRTRDHRQRLALPIHNPRPGMPRAGRPAPTHPAQATADQRQSRAPDPHHARRLGLRCALRHQPGTHRRP